VEASESISDISTLPASVLYDFCNAFPMLLHAWLLLVLRCYKLRPFIRNIIKNLYKEIRAYSSGSGDGSFLFFVLCGVRTGCPLSSLLFILCINPFIHLLMTLSDIPGFSVTRVCADDFGSAMKSLYTLRTHASVFSLASRVAGLCLKPGKCVLIVTRVPLEEDIVNKFVRGLNEMFLSLLNSLLQTLANT
jgi:hypothetical protein